MKTASISEAKNKLSAYLELVRRGETVLITDRNVPVAQLAPLSAALRGDDEARLQSLERRGVIRRAKIRPGKDFLKRLPPVPKVKGDVLAALLAEREESR
jgi:prevent-host-death family protein